MTKKLARMLMIVFTFVAILGVPSYAVDDSIYEVKEAVVEANDDIYTLIDKAVAEGEKVSSKFDSKMMNAATEEEKMALQAEKASQIQAIANQVIADTANISKEVRTFAADEGIYAICEFIPVNIGGTVFMVDPVRIIKPW